MNIKEFMMKIAIAPLIGLALLLTGCESTPNYDYDDTVNFSQLSTYAWVVESKPVGSDKEYFNSDINNKRIVNAIEAKLADKGLRKVSPSEASVLVNYHTTISKKRERDVANTHPFYWSFGHGYYGSRWGVHMNLNSLQREYKEGALVVDFIAPNKALIWRGSYDTRLSQKSTPEKRAEKVNTAVNEILANFPPQ